MSELPAFRAVALRDAVADALRRALLERHFAPGEAMVESAIAAQMKVSRGPVREALLLLMQEGLVTHSQNHGFAVLNFTGTERRDAGEVRMVLETLALERARERAKATDITELEAIGKRMMATFDTGDAAARLAEEIAFHTLIWRLSGNPTLANTLSRVTLPIFLFVTAYQADNSLPDRRVFGEQHRLYVEYLRRQTPKSAAECVQFHMGLPQPDATEQNTSSIQN